jgi:CRISPR system Cascade subunit CasB
VSNLDLVSLCDEFITNLSKLDRGDRARLRRSAGRSLAESMDVAGIFYRALPYQMPPRHQEMAFLVATLFPMAPDANIGDFGVTLNRLASSGAGSKQGIERRFNALLDADRAALPFRMRQLVRLVDSHRGQVNWRRLLRDLLYWDHPDRFVQRNWAMSFYRTEREEQTPAPELATIDID